MKNYTPILKATLLFILAFFLFTCSKKPVDPTIGKPILTDNINPEVVVLSQSAVKNDILSASTTEISFPIKSSSAANIKVGSVLVADTSARFPYGMLRKVKSSSELNGVVTYSLERASLSDVIKEGKIDLSKTFYDPKRGRLAGDSPYQFQIKYVFKDLDGIPETTHDAASIDGSVQIAPKVDFHWEKSLTSIEPERFEARLSGDISGAVKATLGSAVYSEKVAINKFPYHLGVLRGFIGPVPIIIRVDLNFYAGFELGSPLDASIGFSIAKNYNVAGVYKKGGGWSSDNQSGNSDFKFISPADVKGKTLLKVSIINPRIELLPYDFEEVKAYTGLDFGYDAKLDCDKKPNFEAGAYLKGEIGFSTDFNKFSGLLNTEQKFVVDILPEGSFRTTDTLQGCQAPSAYQPISVKSSWPGENNHVPIKINSEKKLANYWLSFDQQGCSGNVSYGTDIVEIDKSTLLFRAGSTQAKGNVILVWTDKTETKIPFEITTSTFATGLYGYNKTKDNKCFPKIKDLYLDGKPMEKTYRTEESTDGGPLSTGPFFQSYFRAYIPNGAHQLYALIDSPDFCQQNGIYVGWYPPNCQANYPNDRQWTIYKPDGAPSGSSLEASYESSPQKYILVHNW